MLDRTTYKILDPKIFIIDRMQWGEEFNNPKEKYDEIFEWYGEMRH